MVQPYAVKNIFGKSTRRVRRSREKFMTQVTGRRSAGNINTAKNLRGITGAATHAANASAGGVEDDADAHQPASRRIGMLNGEEICEKHRDAIRWFAYLRRSTTGFHPVLNGCKMP